MSLREPKPDIATAQLAALKQRQQQAQYQAAAAQAEKDRAQSAIVAAQQVLTDLGYADGPSASQAAERLRQQAQDLMLDAYHILQGADQ